MASPVLVTGGTGRLGKLVVARLQDSGCDVRVLARHHRPTPPGVTFFTADLRTGEGIEPAVTGAAAIIHCATSTRGDAEATRNLVTAASRTGSPHLVYVSIVGIDSIASWGYPKTKLQAEQIVAGSGLPWTILRVTQFYDYCLTNAQKLSRFSVAPVPAGFTVQPVDPRDAAERLVELVLGEPAGRAPDLAGPQVTNWTDLLRGYLTASHRRRWVLPVRIPGTRAVRNGALLPPPGHTIGSRTWDQFLTTELRQRTATTGWPRPQAGLRPPGAVSGHPSTSHKHQRSTAMQARMKNPGMVIPDAMMAIRALNEAIKQGGVPPRTLDLVHLRSSQINGCSVCVGAAAKAKKDGETDERLFTLVAWRDTPYFTDAERAALALTEAVTRLSDRTDPVPDEIWNEAARHYDEPALAALVLWIATVNVFNRVNVATRQIPGTYPGEV